MRHLTHALVLSLVAAACSDPLTPSAPGRVPFALMAGPSLAAGAPTIRHYPGESPGPPYYAFLDRGYVPNDGRWAGIVFVRSPECVPPGFNLLDFLNPPVAWGCALTVEGEAWWHDPLVPPAFQLHERGMGAVPVYFVRWSEIETAIADDLLTIGELQSLPSLLIGSATFLQHVVHNANQAANHGHEALVARGTLEDGRAFEFRFNEKFLPETGEHVFSNVKITFK